MLVLLRKGNVIIRAKKNINVEVGSRIQLAREAAGLTQEQLAEQLDLTTQFISIIERGVSGASLETIVKLCRVLNVSCDYLLLGKRDAPSAERIAARCLPLSDEQRIVMDRVVADIVALLNT